MHLNWTQPAFFHNMLIWMWLGCIALQIVLNYFLFSFDKHTMIEIILPISHLADSSTIHFINIISLP